jgi:outer membrane protein assembly factor BamA
MPGTLKSMLYGCSFAGMPVLQRSVIFLALVVCLSPVLAGAQDTYALRLRRYADDTTVLPVGQFLQSVFPDSAACALYLSRLPARLIQEGFLEASLDSIRRQPSAVDALLYVGPRYRWRSLAASSRIRDSLRMDGWSWFPAQGDVADMSLFDRASSDWVAALGRRGFPFASIRLDSLQTEHAWISARLAVDRGPLYRIDSITIDGGLRLRSSYLYRYLDIPPGSPYRTDKLETLSDRLSALPFLKEVRPWDITRTGTGAALNLHVAPRKSNRMDALVAFLPSNSQVGGRLLLAGEANLDLHNAFGGAERIIANWQQLQVGSPRLQLAFEQPYIFGSRFEADVRFMLFRKDSSFLNLDFRTGIRFMVDPRKKGGLFYQRLSTSVLTVDTNGVKSSRQLPSFSDVSSDLAGLSMSEDRTDRPMNPRSGLSWKMEASAGIRRLRPNATISALQTDALGTPFDFGSLYPDKSLRRPMIRTRLQAAHHIPAGRQAALKLGMQAGYLLLKDPFRNELFQIGGYRTLRGFDEERIFASAFGIGTVEFRWLTGPASHFFAFTDFGHTVDQTQAAGQSHNYIGAGLGLRLETRAGILDLAWAAGKRTDQPLDMRQSKIHFGILSVF